VDLEMDIDKNLLAKANEKLTDADVITVLKWAKKTFGDSVAFTTAFGYSGIAILHHALQVWPDIKVYFIDTGFHFKETLEFCKDITEKWNLNLEVIKPDITKKELGKKIGKEPYKVNADLCCHYCKVEPLLRVLHNHSAWLSGIRRDQSRTRGGIEVIDVDGRGMVKICPMAKWTREKTWNYIKKNKLPYHPLHDKGYPSIGCQPCTAPVAKGGDERDGRWPDMQKLECGIHLFDNKKKGD
jgi:phosphoadenosine phosphosulfate reductase